MAFKPPADLTGQVALVSGASRGVGRAYALALASAGAAVMATARSDAGDPTVPGTLAELVETGRREGLRIAARRCDVGVPADIDAAVRAAVDAFGGLDILVNNAVAPIAQYDVFDVPDAEWDAVFRTNVQAPYAFARAAAPHLAVRGGAIVNVTSGAAKPTALTSGAHGYPAYAVSKAALERLTTYLAAELAPMGIAVNAISPGNVAYYIRDGKAPELSYWGAPMVYLAAQRPPAGLTSQILHTYDYAIGWADHLTPPERNLEIRDMLHASGVIA